MLSGSVRPRVVFMGTPAFAVPCLQAVCDVADVVAVVCQPDKPAGRGNEIRPPAIKLAAQSRGLEVHQPVKMKDGTVAAWLRELHVDAAVVVAYGRILPPEVLAAPRLGCVNLHGSLLPRHRGAAPIQWSILSGDADTGVCLMQMDAGLDTGAVLSRAETPIQDTDTSVTLAERLSLLGAELLRRDLPKFFAGALVPTPQDHANATHAPPLTREQSRIDWKRSADEIHAQVRGLHPWPGTSTTMGARRLIVHATTRANAPQFSAGAPGEVIAVTRDAMWVATSNGAIGLTELQYEGKKRLPAHEFLAGHPLRVGTLLGAT